MIGEAELVGEPDDDFDHRILVERMLALPICAGLRKLVVGARFSAVRPR
jgi:hypothetical protein